LAPGAAQNVDAVLLFVNAMQYLYSSSGSYPHSGASLYRAVKNMASPQGLSSSSINLDPSADRLGVLRVVNLRQTGSSTGRRLVAISQPVAVFSEVGSFDTASQLLQWTAEMVFASGGSTVPSDGSTRTCADAVLNYNISATCDSCSFGGVCERTVSFHTVVAGVTHCQLPEDLTVPCDHTATSSLVAVVLWCAGFTLLVVIVAAMFSLLQSYRNETAHRSHSERRKLIRQLLLAVAAIIMAVSPIYFAGTATAAMCTLRPLISVHVPGLILLSVLEERTEVPTRVCRIATSGLMWVGFACYLAAIVFLAKQPLQVRLYPLSYGLDATHVWALVGNGRIETLNSVCSATSLFEGSSNASLPTLPSPSLAMPSISSVPTPYPPPPLPSQPSSSPPPPAISPPQPPPIDCPCFNAYPKQRSNPVSQPPTNSSTKSLSLNSSSTYSSNVTQTNLVIISGSMYEYPSDYGLSSCMAHDATLAPDETHCQTHRVI